MPPLVRFLFSIKVSDCISLLNLSFSQRRPACAECVSPLQGFKPLYKPRLGHPESHSSCKQRQKTVQSRQSVIFSLALFPWVLCGKLWYWLCVCWWLGFSPWKTQHMGWSSVAVSSSGQSSSLVEAHDGDGRSGVQVRYKLMELHLGDHYWYCYVSY